MKVAIYCRLSDEDKNKKMKEDDSESIQNQKSMLIDYAVHKNWEIYNIYSDDDYTGADRNRPDFNRLLRDASERKFDIVLCKTQSRFTRELEIVEKYIHTLFPIWKIRFVSIVDNADTEIKGNKKARQINGLINEWYLEDMSENIKSVLTNRREKGFHIGSFALYGYKKNPNQKGHLIIDEPAAKIVREVFTLFSQGYGKSKIARMLNDRGVPNPTEYKRLNGLRYKQGRLKNSTLWKYYAISDMLINETYIGNMVQGKYGSVSYKTKQKKPIQKENWIRVEGTHEPIIDIQLWNAVQRLVKQKTKPLIIGQIGLFAKKAKCQNCGYTMRSTKTRGNYNLLCSTKAVAKDACIGSFISVKKLEQAVLNELKNLSAKYLDKGKIENEVQFNDRLHKSKELVENEIKNYEKKIIEYDEGIKSLYLDKVKGIITEDDFILLSKGLHQDKQRFEKLIKQSSDQLSEINDKIISSTNQQEIIENYTNIENLTREIVDCLVDYVVVGKKNEQKEIPVTVYWNF